MCCKLSKIGRFVTKTWLKGLFLLLPMMFLYQPAYAAPQPSYGNVIVNGDISDWDLGQDFFAPMYEAGKTDKDHISDLYLKYDCNTKVLYVLVLDHDLTDAYKLERKSDQAWFKVYELGNNTQITGNSGNNGVPPDFSWVELNPPEADYVYGWEGSMKLDPGTYTIEAHNTFANPSDNTSSRTTSSGSKAGTRIQVTLQCGAPPPNPQIDIEKATNGQDADSPTGPLIEEGQPVTWTYVVTNIGNVDLSNVHVTDDQLGDITCPKDSLVVGESMECTANGVAVVGQYENKGTATGSYNGQDVSDMDLSHYKGVPQDTAAPSIDVEKSTNGFDADVPTGPNILVGESVDWSYKVTNTGNVPLTNINLSDNIIGVISCPKDHLAVGEMMTCTAMGTSIAGQYENKGTVNGDYTDALGNVTTVMDMDPSHYFGANPSLDIEKHTQGFDADSATGPYIHVGDTVYWLYSVTNTGNVDLTNVHVVDDQGAAVDCDGAGGNIIASIPVGETRNCSAQGVAVEGQYANQGTASATYTDDFGHSKDVSDTDPSHYFGVRLSIDVEKATNGSDADYAPGVFVIEGDPVHWTYVVTNTSNVKLKDISLGDDQLGAITCPKTMLDVGESMECTADGVAMLGQYANLATVEGTSNVPVCTELPDGTIDCENIYPKAMGNDPSHYYGFVSNQPSISVNVLSGSVLGDQNQYANGEFLLTNESSDATAIGVEQILFTIEYRTPDTKGKNWNGVIVDSTCTTDPMVPFVFVGPGEGSPDPGQQLVTYHCSLPPGAIPDDASAVRVTVCVEIFNRQATAKKDRGDTYFFCSSGQLDF